MEVRLIKRPRLDWAKVKVEWADEKKQSVIINGKELPTQYFRTNFLHKISHHPIYGKEGKKIFALHAINENEKVYSVVFSEKGREKFNNKDLKECMDEILSKEKPEKKDKEKSTNNYQKREINFRGGRTIAIKDRGILFYFEGEDKTKATFTQGTFENIKECAKAIDVKRRANIKKNPNLSFISISQSSCTVFVKESHSLSEEDFIKCLEIMGLRQASASELNLILTETTSPVESSRKRKREREEDDNLTLANVDDSNTDLIPLSISALLESDLFALFQDLVSVEKDQLSVSIPSSSSPLQTCSLFAPKEPNIPLFAGASETDKEKELLDLFGLPSLTRDL